MTTTRFTPLLLPLPADRFTPYVQVIRVTGVDLTLATLVMQVRLLPNAAGDPELDFAVVTDAADDGIYFEGVEYDGDVPTSTIVLRWADISGLPGNEAGDEPGSDTTLYYDLAATLPFEDEELWFYGPFTVRAGVTQP